MKKLLACLLFVSVAGHVLSQSAPKTPYLWPVEGLKAGDGILYAPQSYIDGEFNFGQLYITAPEGTVVVAPCDGTIEMLYLSYTSSLTYSNSMSVEGSIDESRTKKIASGTLNKSFNPKYLSGGVRIKTEDGYNLYIDGLSGEEIFKTGQKITRGTPIGRVAYTYYKIPEPSINLSINRGGTSSDPMTPFGIKTTFIPPAEFKPIVSLTREQATEDFNAYIAVLKECFVGLYNVITPEELEAYVNRTLADINSREGDIPYLDFREIITAATAKIHDSHISMGPPQWKVNYVYSGYMPQIWFGFLSDTLRVSNATETFKHLLGRQITSVDGIPADSIRKFIVSTASSYDAKIESYKQYLLGTTGFVSFLDRKKDYANNRYDLKVVFADGEQVEIPGEKQPKWINNLMNFTRLNRGRPYETKMLSDSVAYLGIGTFSLNQVQTETIGAFIDSIAAVPNLVIDVRNNNGGQGDVIGKLYSYIAGKPMTLHGYSKVSRNTNYETFKYSMNHTTEEQMFPDYKPEEGKQGFYDYPHEETVVKADSVINYKGRIYMLTNEYSISAATLFPAMLVRNHRGVTVGRETRSAYHFMNAVKFVEIRLPTSMITVNLPLIETHFDDVVNERVPYGRGVMPDYQVPLTYEEIVSERDVMLDYTLGLIERDEYFRGDNPFAEPEHSSLARAYWIWIAGGVVVMVIFIAIAVGKSKNRYGSNSHRQGVA